MYFRLQSVFVIGVSIFVCCLLPGCKEDGPKPSSNAPEKTGIENVALFCASFTGNDDEYQLFLEKNITLYPDSNWVYPDKVKCNAGFPCKSKWIHLFFLNVPHEGDVIQRYKHKEMSRMGYRLLLKDVPVQPIDSALKLSSMQFEMLEIKLSNARDSMQHYYGRLLEGVWMARQLNDSTINYKRPFSAKIVGECKSPSIVSNYCLSDNLHVLSQKETKHVYPLTRFFAEESRICSKKYRIEKKMSLIMGDLEKDVLSFEENGDVGKQYLVDSKIVLPMLQFINVDSTISNIAKKTEQINAVWNVSLDCDEEHFEGRIPFAIGMLGLCEHDPFIIELDPEYSMYRQGKPTLP